MSRLVFVCPECGSILDSIWEVSVRRGDFLITPDGTIVDESLDDWTPQYLECGECGAQIKELEEDLIVEIVEEEDSGIVYAAPVGDFWVKRPELLADLLATSTGKKVEVVSRDQLPA